MTSYFVVFAISLAVSLIATPIAAKLGLRWGIVAVPDERRRHVGTVPRSGGIALYLSFAAALLAIAVMPTGWMPPAPEGPDPNEITRLAGVFFGLTFLFVVGLVDDLKELSARTQLVFHIIASLIAMAFLIFIEVINNPFTDTQFWIPWPLPFLITIVWIAGMISTVNLLDGLDGLAAGVTAIVSVVLVIHMVREEQYSVALLPLGLLGSTLGFLPFNLHPAKVFMGGGAYLLGYAIGTLSIIAGARVATILLVMGIPIMDMAWQAYIRWRAGSNISRGDRGHLHFRLLDLGLSQRQIVGLYYLVTAGAGAVALTLSTRLFKFLALVALGAFGIWILISTRKRA